MPDVLRVERHPIVKAASENLKEARRKFHQAFDHALTAKKNAQRCRIEADRLRVNLIDATGAELKRLEQEIEKCYDDARRHEDRSGVHIDLDTALADHLKPYVDALTQARIEAAAEISAKVLPALQTRYQRMQELLTEAGAISEEIFTAWRSIEGTNNTETAYMKGVGLESGEWGKSHIRLPFRKTFLPEVRARKGPSASFISRIRQFGWTK